MPPDSARCPHAGARLRQAADALRLITTAEAAPRSRVGLEIRGSGRASVRIIILIISSTQIPWPAVQVRVALGSRRGYAANAQIGRCPLCVRAQNSQAQARWTVRTQLNSDVAPSRGVSELVSITERGAKWCQVFASCDLCNIVIAVATAGDRKRKV